MKKLTTSLAGLFLLLSANAFTVKETDVTAKIKTGFEKDFISATDVKWTEKDDIYIASFKENNIYLSAAYNEDGELLSVARYVKMSQLPFKVVRSLESEYSSYTIDPTVVELSAEQTSYYIYAENKKFKLKIRSDASGNLNVESKTKK